MKILKATKEVPPKRGDGSAKYAEISKLLATLKSGEWLPVVVDDELEGRRIYNAFGRKNVVRKNGLNIFIGKKVDSDV